MCCHLTPDSCSQNCMPELASAVLRGYILDMTVIAEKLDRKLHDWRPELASEVEDLVAEIIEMADTEGLDILRSRHIEQEVLDLIDDD